jgi:parvulin-like peptidyl-prolyl isomerase
MKPTRIALPLLAAAFVFVLVAAGCGSSKDKAVPTEAVAVVDGAEIPKPELEAVMLRAKKSYVKDKRAFPKAGTAEYQALQTQVVGYLVTRQQYDQQAKEMKLVVTEKEIDDRVAQYKKQIKNFSKELVAQGYTPATFRAEIRTLLVSQKLYDSVTKSAKVTDDEIQKYYDTNRAKFQVAESRDVRHILLAVNAKGVPVSEVKAGGDTTVDFAKSKVIAEQTYAELAKGADFAVLAKKLSQDPGSKDQGGKYTVIKGQTVPPFEQTAFLLRTNVISKPVKTQFGYHVIQPVGAVKPATTTPLAGVKEQIRSELLTQKKNDLTQKWEADFKKQYEKKVAYATGFAPPAAATSTGTSTNG